MKIPSNPLFDPAEDGLSETLRSCLRIRTNVAATAFLATREAP